MSLCQGTLGALEGLLALDESLCWVEDLMWAVLARFGDTRLEARLDEIGIKPWDVTPEHVQTIWADTKSELGIPEVPPMEIDLECLIPVGGRTPS